VIITCPGICRFRVRLTLFSFFSSSDVSSSPITATLPPDVTDEVARAVDGVDDSDDDDAY
jgi:hypothetical protein